MAKFCGKCGAQLDQYGRCPNCTAGKGDSTVRQTPGQKTNGRKKQKKTVWKWIAPGLALLALAACALFGLAAAGVVSLPEPISDLMGGLQNGSGDEPAAVSIGDNYVPEPGHVVYDTDDGQSGYVDNMILAFFRTDCSEQRAREIADEIGGEIVGSIPEIHQFQIQVPQRSKEELEALCKQLQQYPEVKAAMIDHVVAHDLSAPDDPWKDTFQGLLGVDWDEDSPGGTNWWAEAVKLPSAWEHDDSFHDIDVGIVDNGFDTDHEDLQIDVLNHDVNSKEDHGTHVAGIIGATANNQLGITGILYHGHLKCVDCYATKSQEKANTTVSSLMAGITQCVANGCKVVNMSSGIEFDGNNGEGSIAADSARDAIIYLLYMLDSLDTEFLVVQAAGNDGVDASFNGFFSSITPQRIQSVLDEFEDMGMKMEKKLSEEDVFNSFLVVGAVDNKKKDDEYQLTDFSNYGDAIDVCAPGKKVFSTIVSGGMDGSYGYKDGTSMAAPIVAGVASLVWSIDETMSPEQVKNIVIDTADQTVRSRKKKDNGTYSMVNASAAVEEAIRIFNEADQEENPYEEVTFNGHRYRLFIKDNIDTWEAAGTFCQTQGGHLATLTSSEENHFVHDYILKNHVNAAYFGYSDADSEGHWRWINDEQTGYANWFDGEPNNGKDGENYAMFYHADQTDRWNDGDFGVQSEGGKAFICEWDDTNRAPAETEAPVQTEAPAPPPVSEERDVVLVLDTSGSMSGDPINETKKAAIKFVQTVLPQNAGVGIVTFDSSASVVSGFSKDEWALTEAINNIRDGGATNTEAGLSTAYDMLRQSNARKRIIVLMSDGMPNNGREGQDLIDYANSIKSDDVYIYTLGFFSELSEGEKISAQALMEGIASDGCHYEVADADDLVFFFNDIADQINGQKYIYVRIACPVDVSVHYNGQRLDSAEDHLSLRTDFGTLTFEQNEVDEENPNQDDRVKVLRLKEGVDYDVQIEGTGRGVMEYTIGFMDEDGKYSDFRKFQNVRITEQTVIDTVAAVADESVLNVDEDGDGKYDIRYSAAANEYGRELKQSMLPYILICADALAAIIIILIILIRNRNNQKSGVRY